MTTTPNPKIVREIARDCVADYIDDARDIAAHVMGHLGMGVPGDVYAWTDAVRTDLRAVVPSWPDEQPQDERDAQLADLATELDAANDNADEIADRASTYREEIMRLRARIRELSGAQDERDGDVRAVAALLAACDNEVGAADDAVARAMDAVEDRFADRIAALDARDAKAGEQR